MVHPLWRHRDRMEILIEAHVSIAEEVAATLEIEMVKSFNHYAPTVPMVAKATVSDCWVH